MMVWRGINIKDFIVYHSFKMTRTTFKQFSYRWRLIILNIKVRWRIYGPLWKNEKQQISEQVFTIKSKEEKINY